jgi:2-succinyl-6-hydroxy-2,4-cyclohexadiene-1-carboxylate synthase
MTKIRANNVNYHVEMAGKGEALLMLHGFMGSAQSWHRQWDSITERYKVIAIDLPGHGNTENPTHAARHTIESVAADIAEILDQLEINRIHFLGYSMGGRIALYFAVHHPERVQSLLLESASPGLDNVADREARRAADAALAMKIESSGLAAFVDYWENLPLFASQKTLPSDIQASIRGQRLRNDPAGLAASLRELGTGSQPSMWSELQHVKLPTLLIVGRADRKFVEIGQQMAAELPQARLEIVEAAGHTVHLEQPERFSELVIDHINNYSVDSEVNAAVKERKR